MMAIAIKSSIRVKPSVGVQGCRRIIFHLFGSAGTSEYPGHQVSLEIEAGWTLSKSENTAKSASIFSVPSFPFGPSGGKMFCYSILGSAAKANESRGNWGIQGADTETCVVLFPRIDFLPNLQKKLPSAGELAHEPARHGNRYFGSDARNLNCFGRFPEPQRAVTFWLGAIRSTSFGSSKRLYNSSTSSLAGITHFAK